MPFLTTIPINTKTPICPHEVEGTAGCPKAPSGAPKGEGNGDENGEGVGQRLELRCHDDVDEKQGEKVVHEHLLLVIITVYAEKS